jgi:3-oxoacyl-[acyl-carrier protein] reductase
VDFGIKGKTALVLGAGGGLGNAIAQSLAAEGASVALADVAGESLPSVLAQVEALGVQGLAVQWDLADLGVIEDRIGQIEARLGGVDILINNTGGPPPTPVAGQDAVLWLEYFQAMVVSVIKITDRVLPGMRDRKWGRVVTSTSSGVVSPIANLGLSNTLRIALLGWSKTLAREVGREGITSNIILPGRIATSRTRFLDEQKARRENRDVAAVSAESSSGIPLGRYGEPEEYAKVVTFLASTAASYLTGSVIRVDGGLIASV